jgi:hypothetical protein
MRYLIRNHKHAQVHTSVAHAHKHTNGQSHTQDRTNVHALVHTMTASFIPGGLIGSITLL